MLLPLAIGTPIARHVPVTLISTLLGERGQHAVSFECDFGAAQRVYNAVPGTVYASSGIACAWETAELVAKHLGVQSEVGDAPAFIHAYSGHGVVESPLSLPWARRIVARFEFPKKVA